MARFTARSYELDILGHVNNAVYLNWLEQARLSAFQELGYPVEEIIRRRWSMALARIEIDYRREVRFGQAVVVTTSVERVGRTSFTLAHRMEREGDGALAAEGRAVVVWLGEGGRPEPLPTEMRRKLAPGRPA